MYNSLASFPSLLPSPLRHRRSSMIRILSFLFSSQKGSIFFVFSIRNESLFPLFAFFSFLFDLSRGEQQYSVFESVRLLSLAQDLLETAYECRERDASSKYRSILRRNLWFANFQDSNYVKLFFLFVRLSEQLGRRRRKKELEFKLLKFFNNERLFCGKLIGRGRDIEASGKSNLLDGRKQRFKDGWDGREGAACAHTHSLQRNRCKLWRRYVVVVDDCAAALNNRRCSKVTRDTAPRTLS